MNSIIRARFHLILWFSEHVLELYKCEIMNKKGLHMRIWYAFSGV